MVNKVKKKNTKEKILDALEDKKKISINPPPQDGNCEVCGKNVKDLKPFGKEGDPLVGDFNGALLVKTFRGQECIGASWECRDCIILSDKEYWEKK